MQRRIAILSTGLGHVARGIETWAAAVAAELHRRGEDVALFKGGGVREQPYERVVRCVQRDHGPAKFIARWRPGFAWRFGCSQPYDIEQTTFALSVLPQLIRQRYDVLHMQDPWLALMLHRARKLHGAKVILGHGTEEPAWFLRKLEYVQELSPFYLERHGDLQGRKWFAVPNFIDAQMFSPGDRLAARRALGLPEQAFIVLSVAALNLSKKRLDWLAQEAAASGIPDVHVVIAGATDPETPETLSVLKQRLGDRLTVLSNHPRREMPLVHRAGDVHVMCSLKEVMGISLLESMASGAPNIGHDWGSVKWVIDDAGLIVDMEQPGALAEALRGLHASPEKRAELGTRARHRIEQSFSVDAVIDQYLAMYDSVLASPAKPPSAVAAVAAAPLSKASTSRPRALPH